MYVQKILHIVYYGNADKKGGKGGSKAGGKVGRKERREVLFPKEMSLHNSLQVAFLSYHLYI